MLIVLKRQKPDLKQKHPFHYSIAIKIVKSMVEESVGRKIHQ